MNSSTIYLLPRTHPLHPQNMGSSIVHIIHHYPQQYHQTQSNITYYQQNSNVIVRMHEKNCGCEKCQKRRYDKMYEAIPRHHSWR